MSTPNLAVPENTSATIFATEETLRSKLKALYSTLDDLGAKRSQATDARTISLLNTAHDAALAELKTTALAFASAKAARYEVGKAAGRNAVQKGLCRLCGSYFVKISGSPVLCPDCERSAAKDAAGNLAKSSGSPLDLLKSCLSSGKVDRTFCQSDQSGEL